MKRSHIALIILLSIIVSDYFIYTIISEPTIQIYDWAVDFTRGYLFIFEEIGIIASISTVVLAMIVFRQKIMHVSS